MQGAFNATSNGKQTGRSVDHDGENSDEAHTSEEQFSEEVHTGYNKENVGEVKDLSLDDLAENLSWEVKEEKSENHQRSTDQDPLVDSLFSLQSVQEALEKGLVYPYQDNSDTQCYDVLYSLLMLCPMSYCWVYPNLMILAEIV